MVIAEPSQTNHTGRGAGHPDGVTVVSHAIWSEMRWRSICSVSSNPIGPIIHPDATALVPGLTVAMLLSRLRAPIRSHALPWIRDALP